MKKNRLYLMVMCCISLLLCVPCLAAEAPPHFELNSTADIIQVDETLYLLVDINDNVGFGATQLCITYDKDKLLLDNVSLGEIVPTEAIASINTDISGEINFSVISIQDITDSGTLLVSKFRAKNAGTAKFDLKLIAYADVNGTSLNSTSEDVQILIESATVQEETEIEHEVDSKDIPDDDTPRPRQSGGSGIVHIRPAETENDPADQTPAEAPKQNEEKQISFNDVARGHWAYAQIHEVAKRGLFSGTGENIFSPDAPMTRAMFVTVLHRNAGSPEAEKASFDDVEDSWYTDAVSWAAYNGIVSGVGENKFSPNSYITRGQIATILYRYTKAKCANVDLVNSFNDSDSIPSWGKESIAWAIEQGLILGRSSGNIAFSDNATRAETAVIFTRFLNINTKRSEQVK